MSNFLDATFISISLTDARRSQSSRSDRLCWREEEIHFREEEKSWFLLRVLERQEDILWRKQELLLSDLLFVRRQLDERSEMLRNIGNISSLLAGFSLMILVDMNLDPSEIDEWLLALYSAVSSFTSCLMTFSLVSCTLITVAILKRFKVSELETGSELLLNLDFVALTELSIQRRQSFQRFWKTNCEEDFNRAFSAFSLGVPLFLLNTVLATWVKFSFAIEGCILTTIVCGLTILFLFWTSQMKWTVWFSQDLK